MFGGRVVARRELFAFAANYRWTCRETPFYLSVSCCWYTRYDRPTASTQPALDSRTRARARQSIILASLELFDFFQACVFCRCLCLSLCFHVCIACNRLEHTALVLVGDGKLERGQRIVSTYDKLGGGQRIVSTYDNEDPAVYRDSLVLHLCFKAMYMATKNYGKHRRGRGGAMNKI